MKARHHKTLLLKPKTLQKIVLEMIVLTDWLTI